MPSKKTCIWLNEKDELCCKDVIEGSNFCEAHSPRKRQSKNFVLKGWLEHTTAKRISPKDDDPWTNKVE